MKFKKKLFDRLHAEKQNADNTAFNYQIAIESLQNLCDHKWANTTHGHSFDDSRCEICGKYKDDTENRKDEAYS